MNVIEMKTPKFLVGIETRTQNSLEIKGEGKIPALWNQFFNFFKIDKKISSDIYAIYSNYESDENGQYDYFIGYEIANPDKYLNGDSYVVKQIEVGTYSVISPINKISENVAYSTWQKIWRMNAKQLGGERLFHTDFEVYTNDKKNGQQSLVNIYLSLKK
ncbi:GyrI-like domain-containing protein [Fluviispira sanaruensis]|uniref:AraC family transcriptional regulator n=1 Tax=Fluviispira sanaruensis TaxID=2493639 RepID=A0A4P2VM15_FLUSA|nr:effector binding domain-containing protein [Fluviispira sanaruensis]BBH53044.1 AraC family transcriptional regulator [Fluviispira sanaruensis]